MQKIKLIGIPYEGPEDFVKGTALAPSRIRWAMDSIEDYSVYQKKHLPE
jgi:arginase family enzyme